EYASLSRALRRMRPKHRLDYFERLPEPDQKYLSSWFDVEVLEALDRISCRLEDCRNGKLRNFFRLCQSNILRKVSWQEEDDLRVRRKKVNSYTFADVIEAFLKEAERNAKHVAALLAVEKRPLGKCVASIGDIRELDRYWGHRCDVVITSPPYATALPYLDTD